MTQPTIRQIRLEDNEQMAKVIRAAFVELGAPLVHTVYDDPRTDSIFQKFQRKDAEYWVIDIDGQVLGGCGYFPTEGLPAGMAEVVKFYFSSSIRGKGYGHKLLSLIEERAKASGYTQLYIESFPEFSRAVNMYYRAGFKPIPNRLGNSGHTATTIHVVKTIQ